MHHSILIILAHPGMFVISDPIASLELFQSHQNYSLYESE